MHCTLFSILKARNRLVQVNTHLAKEWLPSFPLKMGKDSRRLFEPSIAITCYDCLEGFLYTVLFVSK